MSNGNILRRGGNGPQLPRQPRNIEDEIGDLARTVERKDDLVADEHPALAACRKAAEMVRNIYKAHSGESETLAQHIEHIGETFLGLCKEAANKIREQRILPEEMSNKTADELELMGKTETERQLRVSAGLKAARDAIVGIDTKS